MDHTHTPTHRPTIDDFDAIYELYGKAIYRYCLNRCRDTQIGEDLTQETFMRLCMCLQRKEEILHTRALLYRIAFNLIIDYVRKKKEASLDVLIETGFEPAVDPWHQTYARLDAQRPLKKLKTMHKPLRQALHYRFVRGLSPAEIATKIGESSNVVSVRIHRGLRHLQNLLKE